MKDRNQFIEADGLYWENETQEWFIDKSLTQYAHKDSVTKEDDTLPHIFCFWVRDKATGEYEQVVMDNQFKEVVYSSKFGSCTTYVDRLKVEKRFGMHNERFIARVFEEVDKEDEE